MVLLQGVKDKEGRPKDIKVEGVRNGSPPSKTYGSASSAKWQNMARQKVIQ